jgi:hypothetical protein
VRGDVVAELPFEQLPTDGDRHLDVQHLHRVQVVQSDSVTCLGAIVATGESLEPLPGLRARIEIGLEVVHAFTTNNVAHLLHHRRIPVSVGAVRVALRRSARGLLRVAGGGLGPSQFRRPCVGTFALRARLDGGARAAAKFFAFNVRDRH